MTIKEAKNLVVDAGRTLPKAHDEQLIDIREWDVLVDPLNFPGGEPSAKAFRTSQWTQRMLVNHGAGVWRITEIKRYCRFWGSKLPPGYGVRED